jgi:hypothetical protein
MYGNVARTLDRLMCRLPIVPRRGRALGSMRRVLRAILVGFLALRAQPIAAQCEILGSPEVPTTGNVFVAGEFAQGYDIGLDTDMKQRDWLDCDRDTCAGCCRMAMPSGQQWGAVFITVGKPANPPRPARDFSGFQRLHLELRGELGGESVKVGLKDACDPDNGTEIKQEIGPVTTDWQSFDFDVSLFSTANTSQLYVLTEFVFDSNIGGVEDPRTVFFRDIRFLVAAPASCGDADRSGSITVTDGVQTLRAAAGLTSPCSLDVCDIDGSGAITVTDGVQVLRAAAGLPVEFRCSSLEGSLPH